MYSSNAYRLAMVAALLAVWALQLSLQGPPGAAAQLGRTGGSGAQVWADLGSAMCAWVSLPQSGESVGADQPAGVRRYLLLTQPYRTAGDQAPEPGGSWLLLEAGGS